MKALTLGVVTLLLFSGVESKSKTSIFLNFQTVNRITSELEAKTGVRLRFIIDKNIKLSKAYMETTAGTILENDILIILDEHNKRIYKFQGKNTLNLLSKDFFSFVLENELLGVTPGTSGEKVESAAVILANNISTTRGVSLLSLKNAYIKPVDSIFYRLTNVGPFKLIVKAFYSNMFLFLSLFPVLTWFLFVKVPELLLGEEAGEKGRKFHKGFLFGIFCVIITRVGTDFNRLVGAVAATLVIFMPLVAIAAAIFKEELKSFTVNLFGWED